MDPKDLSEEKEKLGNPIISRRQFLGHLAALAVLPYSRLFSSIGDLMEQEVDFKNTGSDELTSFAAVLSSIDHFSQESNYDKRYPRSLQFIDEYYRNLGFSVSEYPTNTPSISPNVLDAIPASDIRMQVDYLKILNNSLCLPFPRLCIQLEI